MTTKILVTGHFSAGKTQFIQTLSGRSISTEVKISSEKEMIKKTTTVAMDYGKIKASDIDIHLFGTPGQERFDFMLDILGKDHDGAVVIIDSTDILNVKKSVRFIDFLRKHGKPFVVACNKQDKVGSMAPEEVSSILNLPSDIVFPLTAYDKNSCWNIIDKIISHISSSKKAA
ncbi:MAG TPA: GTP-binding protein [Persephonella sp.]|nr:GTP-binding protein [Persephonella sp.]